MRIHANVDVYLTLRINEYEIKSLLNNNDTFDDFKEEFDAYIGNESLCNIAYSIDNDRLKYEEMSLSSSEPYDDGICDYDDIIKKAKEYYDTRQRIN